MFSSFAQGEEIRKRRFGRRINLSACRLVEQLRSELVAANTSNPQRRFGIGLRMPLSLFTRLSALMHHSPLIPRPRTFFTPLNAPPRQPGSQASLAPTWPATERAAPMPRVRSERRAPHRCARAPRAPSRAHGAPALTAQGLGPPRAEGGARRRAGCSMRPSNRSSCPRVFAVD